MTAQPTSKDQTAANTPMAGSVDEILEKAFSDLDEGYMRNGEYIYRSLAVCIAEAKTALATALLAKAQYYDGENWDDGSVTRNAYRAVPVSEIERLLGKVEL